MGTSEPSLGAYGEYSHDRAREVMAAILVVVKGVFGDKVGTDAVGAVLQLYLAMLAERHGIVLPPCAPTDIGNYLRELSARQEAS